AGAGQAGGPARPPRPAWRPLDRGLAARALLRQAPRPATGAPVGHGHRGLPRPRPHQAGAGRARRSVRVRPCGKDLLGRGARRPADQRRRGRRAASQAQHCARGLAHGRGPGRPAGADVVARAGRGGRHLLARTPPAHRPHAPDQGPLRPPRLPDQGRCALRWRRGRDASPGTGRHPPARTAGRRDRAAARTHARRLVRLRLERL
ncbi:MAG: Ribosomal large subunit pseudouridine synthase C, partial [uncultured Acetobacteraceae bacterium]